MFILEKFYAFKKCLSAEAIGGFCKKLLLNMLIKLSQPMFYYKPLLLINQKMIASVHSLNGQNQH